MYIYYIYVTITHVIKRGGMATCIVIRLITAQAINTNTYFKTTHELFVNVQEFHELKMLKVPYLHLIHSKVIS